MRKYVEAYNQSCNWFVASFSSKKPFVNYLKEESRNSLNIQNFKLLF